MKRGALILALVFCAMALFGTFALHSMAHTSCVATSMGLPRCPGAGDARAFAGFHLDALKYFSSAVLTFAAVFAVLGVVLFGVAALAARFIFTPHTAAYARVRTTGADLRIRRWRALREHSPDGF